MAQIAGTRKKVISMSQFTPKRKRALPIRSQLLSRKNLKEPSPKKYKTATKNLKTNLFINRSTSTDELF
jgi:hypothetical protein